MGGLYDTIFRPPPMPPVHIPWLVEKAVGKETAQATVVEACKFFYDRGVWDGFIGGALLVLIFAQSRKDSR